MKAMTCNQLGGTCELVFQADTFDGMAEQSRAHAMEMMQQQDAAHLSAMDKMRTLMEDPVAMQAWFEGKRAEFEALPEL